MFFHTIWKTWYGKLVPFSTQVHTQNLFKPNLLFKTRRNPASQLKKTQKYSRSHWIRLIKLLPLVYVLQKCVGALWRGHSLQAGSVPLYDRPLDDPVPPLPHIEGLQPQEGKQHPQVLHAVLDGSAWKEKKNKKTCSVTKTFNHSKNIEHSFLTSDCIWVSLYLTESNVSELSARARLCSSVRLGFGWCALRPEPPSASWSHVKDSYSERKHIMFAINQSKPTLEP